MPVILAEHESVEVPEPPAMDVEESVHDKLVELVVTARVTAPAKPLTGATVIVEVPATFAFRVMLVTLAITEKSWTWNVTDAKWDNVPLALVTVPRWLPAGDPWQDKVDTPEPPVMLVVLTVQTRLVELVVTAIVTVLVKPLSGLTVMIDVTVAPAFAFTFVGLAVTV